MSERLERVLRDAEVPGAAAAQERAWDLAHAAYLRRRPPRPVSPRRRTALAVAAATAVVALALALTPAGGKVAHLVAPASAPPAHRPSPATLAHAGVLRLPGGGMVVRVRDGIASIAGPHGTPVRLGPAREATFSAFGHYVATAGGRRIMVYALNGRRVWWRDEAAAVGAIRWAPDGLRVAYRAGSVLRIVDGNGERARTLGPVTGDAFAWRPGRAAVVARVVAPRVAAIDDVGARATIARVRVPAGVVAVTWSGDGRRLLVAGRRALRVFSPRGALLHRRAGRFVAAAYAPGAGRRLALVVRTGASDALLIGGRRVVAAPRLGTPAWSSDGRALLIGAGARTLVVRGGRVVATQRIGRVSAGGWRR